jgi:hypothetical protein
VKSKPIWICAYFSFLGSLSLNRQEATSLLKEASKVCDLFGAEGIMLMPQMQITHYPRDTKCTLRQQLAMSIWSV